MGQVACSWPVRQARGWSAGPTRLPTGHRHQRSHRCHTPRADRPLAGHAGPPLYGSSRSRCCWGCWSCTWPAPSARHPRL